MFCIHFSACPAVGGDEYSSITSDRPQNYDTQEQNTTGVPGEDITESVPGQISCVPLKEGKNDDKFT